MTLTFVYLLLWWKYNKLIRLGVSGLFSVLINMCNIAFIPLLIYTQLQFMRVVPPVVTARRHRSPSITHFPQYITTVH